MHRQPGRLPKEGDRGDTPTPISPPARRPVATSARHRPPMSAEALTGWPSCPAGAAPTAPPVSAPAASRAARTGRRTPPLTSAALAAAHAPAVPRKSRPVMRIVAVGGRGRQDPTNERRPGEGLRPPYRGSHPPPLRMPLHVRITQGESKETFVASPDLSAVDGLGDGHAPPRPRIRAQHERSAPVWNKLGPPCVPMARPSVGPVGAATPG